MTAIERIREQFHSGALQYKKANEIARLLGISSRSEREGVAALLRALEEEGEIVRDERGRFVSPEKLGLIRGVLQRSGRGFAFLLRPEADDLFIPARALRGALHGDEVFVKPVGGARGDEAAVYSVIRRGVRRLTGVYERGKRGGFVYPDDERLCDAVRIAGSKVRAASGEKVCVRIVAYPEGREPEGEIERVIGRNGELTTEEDAIVCAHDLPEEFPPKVLAAAARAAKQPISADGRRDFRGDLVITIDGEDSRDFDDAISVEKRGGQFLLCVHIADVSHYVVRGGALDKEAFRRGTSVYFPDRVLPMLPPALSDDACSLREGQDRYTLSCVMRIGPDGAVRGAELCRGIIRSRNRMTYTQVTQILNGQEDVCASYAHLLPMLGDARELAYILIERRARRGGPDLDLREAQIGIRNGKVEVQARERTISHRMIEAFMICANEAVAAFLRERCGLCLYRVHDKPSEERADAFRAYVRGMGLRGDFEPSDVRPRDYAAILREVEGDGKADVVRKVMLRSMAKARYSAENIGHFGLASECYCHFTSPIRRYPDLLVHRLIKQVLDREPVSRGLRDFVGVAAEDCSVTERRAEEAERDVDELYKVWYMRDHLGERRRGTVSGVTSFGIFVELDNTVEGLIRAEDLPPDEYRFDEARMVLAGRSHAYRLGDPVDILVASCDIGARRCRFLPAH